MKRLHVHVGVHDLEQSVRFYSALFAAQPTVKKSDYAKWMLDDPRVNFAISTHATRAGLDHLGMQAESSAELEEISVRLAQADVSTMPQKSARAATRRATSTGPSIRRESPGNRSAPSTRFRYSARTRARRPKRAQARAATRCDRRRP
jgi:catechol 2,3-dioxygenase-like lactoylglutathione lyase family enzyme